jgi:four helix bundle protein
MQNGHSKTPIVQLSIEFSLMVIKYAEQLEANNKHVIANQVLKNGTAIGAYIMEAQSVDNHTLYYAKLHAADRKAHNTWYWIYLCDQAAGYDVDKDLMKKLEQIMASLHTLILAEKKS